MLYDINPVIDMSFYQDSKCISEISAVCFAEPDIDGSFTFANSEGDDFSVHMNESFFEDILNSEASDVKVYISRHYETYRLQF